MDNIGTVPVIPSGTEPTVFGTPSFVRTGQTVNMPNSDKPVAQTQQTNTQEAAGGETARTYEELAAKKGFKSPEDLARSYMELEKAKTLQSMDMAELLRVKLDAQESQPGTQDMSHDEAIRIVESIVEKRVRPLQETLEIQKAFKNPEDMQYASEVAGLVKSNPTIPWSIALEAIKYRHAPERLKEEGKNEAYQTIQSKQPFMQSDEASLARKREVDVMGIVNDRSIPFREVQKILKEKYSQ